MAGRGVESHADLSARIRVLDGVDQEVGYALPEPLLVACHVQLLERLRQQKLLTSGPHERLHHLDRRLDTTSDGDLLRAQLDASLGDTRDIQQIVDQSCQLTGLPPHHAYERAL